MERDELLKAVDAIEAELPMVPFRVLQTVRRGNRPLHVSLTDRLRRKAVKARVWKNTHFLAALRNVRCGLDDGRMRSRGGRDGIYLLDRSFRPVNPMMAKLFDGYLDKEGSGTEDVARALETTVEQLQGARVVSHHLRLLGVLHRAEDEDWLVLVDVDASDGKSGN